ncbi:MAG: hypothetical protein EOP34_04030 [Rickettsiales bacterium]|nr:MAG: hypothetical protein EOP34_04030 [Rickettsiales bacterium]
MIRFFINSFNYYVKINRDIFLSLHSYLSSDISREKLGIRGEILTSSLLDLFPVFELFINASKNYTAMAREIDVNL